MSEILDNLVRTIRDRKNSTEEKSYTKKLLNNKKLSEEKKKYTKIILEKLNPIVSKFVQDNNILIVLDKKNILVGSKTLDITEDILKKLNKFTIDKDLLNEN